MVGGSIVSQLAIQEKMGMLKRSRSMKQDNEKKNDEKIENVGFYHGIKRRKRNSYAGMQYLFKSSEDYGSWQAEKEKKKYGIRL